MQCGPDARLWCFEKEKQVVKNGLMPESSNQEGVNRQVLLAVP